MELILLSAFANVLYNLWNVNERLWSNKQYFTVLLLYFEGSICGYDDQDLPSTCIYRYLNASAFTFIFVNTN